MEKGSKIQKPEYPTKKVNPLSRLTFLWTLPTFFNGFRRELDENDLLDPLKNHRSSRLGDKLEQAWLCELETRKNPKLWRALAKIFGIEYMCLGMVLMFLEIVIKISQPLALAHLIEYFEPNQVSISVNQAYVCAAIIVGASFVNVLIKHRYAYANRQFAMKIRVACCSIMYRKSLRINQAMQEENITGTMTNLLSNDINRFDNFCSLSHFTWLAPLEALIILSILYCRLGFTAIAGALYLLLLIPIQMYLGKKSSNLRSKTARKTDERVRLMNEIISGIQVIKMYTWELPFVKQVTEARKAEIQQIRTSSYLRGTILSLPIFTTRCSIFLSVLTYTLLGNDVRAQYVFVVTSFYNILKQTMAFFFPQGIIQVAETHVSVDRMETFLLAEEVHTRGNARHYQTLNPHHLLKATKIHDYGEQQRRIEVELINVRTTRNTLSDINLCVGAKELIGVMGAVGSGKSSLLCVILRELPLKSGLLNVEGKLSYASQEPWLFPGTVRQNVLFGQPFEAARYNQVIKVCALERDMTLLPYGDRTLIGERGASLSGGQRARINLARAIYKEADIYLLDDPLAAVDTKVGRQLFDECVRGFLRDKCVILVSHQVQHLAKMDRVILMENGRIRDSCTYAELVRTNKLVSMVVEEPAQTYTDVSIEDDVNNSQTESPTESKEESSTGSVSSHVYLEYFRAGGGPLIAVALGALFVLNQILASGADYFITYWTNLEQARSNGTIYQDHFTDLSRNTCITIYCSIIGGVIVVALTRSFAFFAACMKASINLHNNMFDNIVRTSMRFFNTNPSGRILNRFSKDIGVVDEALPSIAMECSQCALDFIGIITIVAIINPWLLIPTAIMIVIFFYLRNFYMSTSRSVKRLESVSRSPVFTHMSASLQGLTTIRAAGMQEVLKREFDMHQDVHSSAFYLFISCAEAFGFWLDMICLFYVTFATFSFFLKTDEHYGGNVGLAITQCINLTGMTQWGMRQWAELENQLTSVERVLQYTRLQHEAKRDGARPAPSWPTTGQIEFRSVYLRYSTEDPPVLKNLDFTINAREKIGIVGRTGAGKSSLISALFQLAQTEGAILVDGIDITQMPYEALRSKISIIPQEPILFSGTLRKNLDPFEEYEDCDLWQALEKVELKHLAADATLGLDMRMLEGGANFSVGQRQLICLARAIVRKNKILVMDEATANVDPNTDALIQATIRREFADCTVLTIAHRLHTVMDSDKVLLMEAGMAVQFAHPHLLLQEAGLFSEMVQQTGPTMSEVLEKIAKESFLQRKF